MLDYYFGRPNFWWDALCWDKMYCGKALLHVGNLNQKVKLTIPICVDISYVSVKWSSGWLFIMFLHYDNFKGVWRENVPTHKKSDFLTFLEGCVNNCLASKVERAVDHCAHCTLSKHLSNVGKHLCVTQVKLCMLDDSTSSCNLQFCMRCIYNAVLPGSFC